jgi:diketogulonate reductase-like aldo/keto reductase
MAEVKDIPCIGFGSYRLKKDDIEKALPVALANGYRQIDTAELYKNQKFIAETLGKHQVDRDKIWITSKIDRFSIRDGTVTKSIQKILNELNTKYIDLVLLHAPTEAKSDIMAWEIVEEYHNKGIFRNIGVSNYKENDLKNILEKCTVKPFTNQIELSPFFVRDDLVDFCKKNDIKVTGHSSLVKGEKFNDNTVKMMADKYSTSPAQILLSWSKQKGYIVLPRSCNTDHIIENINNTVKLEENDMDELSKLSCNYATHPQYL